MKTEMRRDLARQSFEEKIRKVGELIRLSRKVKAQRTNSSTQSSVANRGSLKGTEAMKVFFSERKRERQR
jgi:hypothetical protein